MLVAFNRYIQQASDLLNATSILQVAGSKRQDLQGQNWTRKSRSKERISRNIRNPEGTLWGRSRPSEREDGANAYSE